MTQKQWEAVMDGNPSYFTGPERPVESVSWDDAQEFLDRLNRRDASYWYRLPTEAEWEYAARAGTTDSEEPSLSAVAWYRDNARGETHPVGEKRPNAWGLYDMLGNVSEWCADWYDEAYYNWSMDTDPRGALAGRNRVLRGGSWLLGVDEIRVTYRDSGAPDYKFVDLGFRCLREPRGRLLSIYDSRSAHAGGCD
jgi:formylglycine-generating enzyme required for sulfatase activity